MCGYSQAVCPAEMTTIMAWLPTAAVIGNILLAAWRRIGNGDGVAAGGV